MAPPRPGRAGRLLLPGILALGLLLRLAHWWAVRDEPFFARLAMDSQEYDRWAREIAAGDWLGSEVFFQAPLYPYFAALLYRLFGPRPDAVYLAQIGLAVAGLWALFRAARELAGERAGLAAAAAGAVYGPFLFYDVQLLKESLAVTATCFLLWGLAAARAGPSLGRWLAAGLLAGVLALLRENMLLVLPFLALLAWRRDRGIPGLARQGGALLLGCALALAPVAWRNWTVGGVFLPTTFQGGTNFYIGNNPQADGTYRPIVPGKQIPALERREPVRLAEQELGRELSAAEVSRHWLGKALAWARAHPGDFLRLQLRKLRMFWDGYEWPDAVDYYWVKTLSPTLRLPLLELGGVVLLALAGLFLARRNLAALAPALVFAAAWTLSTVAFFLFSRYRLPVVPALLVLAALPLAALSEAWGAWRAGEGTGARKRTLGFALLALFALLWSRLPGYAPRLDLVHYNLGRIAEEAGRPQEAATHYAEALAHDPDNFLAHLNLGNLAARAGNYEVALRHFQRAAELEPRSDDVQSNLGGVYLALGRPAEARAAFDRALAANPANVAALHNRALLALAEGDLTTARELNARAFSLQPDNPAVRRLRERLAANQSRIQ